MLGKYPHANQVKRKDQCVLSRIRIGHSHLTHCFLLKGEDQPECVPCQASLTVKHILVECVDFGLARAQYYDVQDVKELFDTVNPSVIMLFLREIGLYHRL